MPSTSSPRCCWNARTAWSRSTSNTSSATCLPVVRSESGLSMSPRAARAARISVTGPPRSPRRRLDIPGLSGHGWQRINAVDCTVWRISLATLSQTSLKNRKPTGQASTRRPASLDDVGELAQQRSLALCADDPLYRGTVLEQDQRRDGDHLEVPRGGRIRVDVDLGDGQGACLLGGDLLEHGSDHLARAAPGGPEVHQYGGAAGQHVIGE